MVVLSPLIQRRSRKSNGRLHGFASHVLIDITSFNRTTLIPASVLTLVVWGIREFWRIDRSRVGHDFGRLCDAFNARANR
jgi:hypothetical protein